LFWLFLLSWLALALVLKGRAISRTTLFYTLMMQPDDTHRLAVAGSFRQFNAGHARLLARRFLAALQLSGNWQLAIEQAGICKTRLEQLACRSIAKYGQQTSQPQATLLDSADRYDLIDLHIELDRLLGRALVAVLPIVGMPVLLVVGYYAAPNFSKLVANLESSRLL
jgi:hypothetical protein